MADLDFLAFDCDNHYYEARDAFTRHLDPAFKKRGVQWAVVNGKDRLLAGGRLWRFIPNPTWDPIARPGCLDDYFRGKRPKTSFESDDPQEVANRQIREAFGELDRLADRPEYQNRDARLRTLDAQGLAGCFLFPTQGAGLEEPLSHDTPALVATVHAFNEWIDEDWGFCHQDRIFAAAMMTLADPGAAVEELRHVAAKGATDHLPEARACPDPNQQPVPWRPRLRPVLGGRRRGRHRRRFSRQRLRLSPLRGRMG